MITSWRGNAYVICRERLVNLCLILLDGNFHRIWGLNLGLLKSSTPLPLIPFNPHIFISIKLFLMTGMKRIKLLECFFSQIDRALRFNLNSDQTYQKNWNIFLSFMINVKTIIRKLLPFTTNEARWWNWYRDNA